jgi:hypothetical protein
LYVTKKTKEILTFDSGVKIVFRPVRASYSGVTWDWIMLNDIRLIDPDKYLKIFNHHYPEINVKTRAKLTLSP